jgi:CBS domain containing-hemolysin-like protein
MLEWALFRILTVAIFILATAFFVAAEFSLVSIRETRIEQLVAQGRPGARSALRLKREMDEFLAANQLGVTLSSLALGYVGEAALADILLEVLQGVGWLHTVPFLQQHITIYAHTFSIVVAFLLITYFEVLLGEQVPKALSLHRGERIALAVAGPMDVFIRITRPAVKLMKASARIVLRAFRVPLRVEGGDVHSPEEIKLVATASRRSGLLPEYQEQIIHRAIELDHVTVREIMTPRARIFSLPADMPIELASARVVEEQHSRIPVFDPAQGSDHIIGILYSKDLSRLMHFRTAGARPTGDSGLTLRQVMRDLLVVPETKLAVELLQEFQERRRQIAIVVDEFGSTVGLVTAEDLLEQIVGELDDEFDVAARSFSPTTPGNYEIEGTVPLRDLTTKLQWSFPREAGVETLAGFLLAQLGHIPTPGEHVDFGGRRYTVLQVAGRRVSRIRVQLLPPTPAPVMEELAG